MVQFYPWFKFYFPLFQTYYDTLPYPKTEGKKFKPWIKLNHNIYIYIYEKKKEKKTIIIFFEEH